LALGTPLQAFTTVVNLGDGCIQKEMEIKGHVHLAAGYMNCPEENVKIAKIITGGNNAEL
jgi:hypothetical protein